jgi:hypothetical protein
VRLACPPPTLHMRILCEGAFSNSNKSSRMNQKLSQSPLAPRGLEGGRGDPGGLCGMALRECSIRHVPFSAADGLERSRVQLACPPLALHMRTPLR